MTLSKQHIIGALTFLIAVCGLVAAAAGQLEIGAKGVAIVGIISGAASVAVRLVSNQAIDSAERETPPETQGYIRWLEQRNHSLESQISPPAVPAPPHDSDTLPSAKYGGGQ